MALPSPKLPAPRRCSAISRMNGVFSVRSAAAAFSTPPLLQPESLGIAAELRARGFALMCVARPTRAVTLTVADEDELYDLQFGEAFDALATNPDGPGVERDDFALEIANMDE